MTFTKFRRPAEQEAYRFLHVHGFGQFEEEYGIGNSLLSAWQDLGLVKAHYVWDGTYEQPNSRGHRPKRMVLNYRTFKKYLDPSYAADEQ